jgi:hypothetical protein
MHQKLVKLLIAVILSGSCNNQEINTEKSSTQTGETKKQSPLINCYQYASNTDTITLKLIHVGEAITGTLVYSLKEKDKNKGTIQGNMRGNLLVADYTFLSEGVQSTRQIAFKLEDNGFTEGYGDVNTQNDKVIFKNLDSLKFNDSMKLIEIACQ